MDSLVYTIDNTTKTYACNPATITSNAVTAITTALNIRFTTPKKYKSLKDKNTKPDKIFIKACPDNMFANKRIAILNKRVTYEINSITTIKTNNPPDTPPGIKNLKKVQPYTRKPINKFPKKDIPLKFKVTIK